jgi:hypothetical protein
LHLTMRPPPKEEQPLRSIPECYSRPKS